MTVAEKVSCGLQLACHVWLVVVIVHFTHVTSLDTQEYKLSDALNKVGY